MKSNHNSNTTRAMLISAIASRDTAALQALVNRDKPLVTLNSFDDALKLTGSPISEADCTVIQSDAFNSMWNEITTGAKAPK